MLGQSRRQGSGIHHIQIRSQSRWALPLSAPATPGVSTTTLAATTPMIDARTSLVVPLTADHLPPAPDRTA